MLRIDPLLTLEEAFFLIQIRNQCRLMMTNNQREITLEEQKEWFEQFYIQQNPIKFRVWLLKEEAPIGYLAAKESEEGFFLTEGLLENMRGKGAGSFLLRTLISKENLNQKNLFADIFNDNLASICLHQKLGFVFYKKIDQNIKRYCLINREI